MEWGALECIVTEVPAYAFTINTRVYRGPDGLGTSIVGDCPIKSEESIANFRLEQNFNKILIKMYSTYILKYFRKLIEFLKSFKFYYVQTYKIF